MKNFLLLIFLLLSLTLNAETSGERDEFGYWNYPTFKDKASIKDNRLYDEAALDRLGFWEKCAAELDWFKKWDRLLNWSMPYAEWFIGGKLNISYNCLDRHLLTHPDKVAYIWCNERGEERVLTYRDMYEEVCRLSNGLKQIGVKKGDVVAIYMPMVPEGIAAMLACTRIGAVHSVIFGGTGAGSTKEKIVDAKAKVIITADEGYRRGKVIPFIETIDKILLECPSVEKVVVLERGTTDKSEKLNQPNYISYETLTKDCSTDCTPEWMDSEGMLFVLYTSGTTGKPKGIIHTTGGYLVGVHNTYKWVFDYKENDIFWCTADIGWITGHSYVVYGPMSNGVTQVIYEGVFDYPAKDQAWKIVEKYKPTVFYTAPTLIRTFMKWGEGLADQHDLSSLRLIGSIGEPLNPEAWEWYHKNIGQNRCPIVDTWFQTETGSFVISPIPGLTPLKPGSISNPLPGYEVTILNESAENVKHGLLAITSPFPSMMRGILNNPDRFYKTYWEKWGGRFYYAGDDATQDDDGYFWVRGRADEVIKVSGHRIGTAETENVIVEYPGVSEAAVIGLPDEIRGQKIVALVVLKEGTEASEDIRKKILVHVADYMGKYAQPEAIGFIRDLPKTRSGKILRRVIANLIEGKEVGDLTTLQNPEIIEDLVVVCKKISNSVL